MSELAAGEPARVLAVDGGGIRGLLPARVLAELEARTQRATHELFDLVAGTSTGALLALGLTIPRPGGDRPPPARRMVQLYRDEGPRIFEAPPMHRVRSLGGLADNRYPDDALDAVLEEVFGDRQLSEALIEVIVPTYDLRRRRGYFFKRRRAREDPRVRGHLAREAARAAVAAPTYFEPHPIGDQPTDERTGTGPARVLLDGGVMANNPAMCAFAEVLAHGGLGDDVLLVSLGTGSHEQAYPHEQALDWGLVGWGRRILDVVFDGSQDVVHYQLDHILNQEQQRYHRLQPSLALAGTDAGVDDALDAADPSNIEALDRIADRYIDEHPEQLDGVVAALTGHA